MADQNVHFEDISGGDTGERADTTAIQPYVAGEKVKAAILDRPLENLRGRTEILRSEIEDLKYLVDSNIRWIISSGGISGVATGHNQPKVVACPSPVLGTFTISGTEIVLQPINTPKTDKKTEATYEFGGGTSSLTFTSTLFGYEQPKNGGANPLPRGTWQRIQWSRAAASTLGANHCSVALEGNPVHILHITVATEETTTVAELHAQLDLTTSMATFGFAEVVATGDETDTISWAAITGVGEDYEFTSTVDREMHYLSKVQIDAYFTAYGALTDGDTLSIGYPFLVDPATPVTKGGRRQATPTSGSPNTEVSSSQLFVSSTAPYLIPLSIPICKRVGSDLIFIDGTIFRGDETNGVYFGSSGYTNFYMSTTTTGSSGATAVGVALHTAVSPAKSADTLSLVAGTLQATLEAIQLFVNDKASCDVNELITGAWLINSTWYAYEVSTGGTPLKLMWRSGMQGVISRPGNAQITWNTLSKYAYAKVGVTYDEVYYISVQGGYLEITGGLLYIHTPSTSTGTITITLELAGGGGAGSNNTRGTYRINSATANTTYQVFPANLFTDYQSGIISAVDSYVVWGTSLWFVTPSLTISADVIDIRPTTEVATLGSAVIIHPSPTLVAVNTGILGGHKHAYFNKVLEGFATVPAAPVSGSAGCFGIDTITYMGGRAIVAGSIVTIPEMRTLTGVVNNHMLPGTTLPTTANKTQWYGLWLRSDGVMRVGPLPVYSDGTGVPGASVRMLPYTSAETPTFNAHDYTLVNLVWSYQGNTAGSIRFAGITHAGGNVWVYQQARYGNYLNPVTWTTYVDHKFMEEDSTGVVANAEYHNGRLTSYNAKTSELNGLPGVPSSITNTGIFNIRLDYTLAQLASRISYHMLHNLYGYDPTTFSASPFAPPNVSEPLATPVENLTYDVLVATDYGSALWSHSVHLHDTDTQCQTVDATVVNPFVHASDPVYVPTTAGVVTIGSYRHLNPTSTGDVAYFHIRTLGFMWDRYNAGGIIL